MGILDKIEDKLSGNKHGNTTDKPLYGGNERKSLEKQAATHGQQLPGHSGIPGQTSSAGYGTSSSGHTGTGAASGTGAGAIGGAATSGLYNSGTSGSSSQPYGSSTTGSSTTGSRAQELRHPVQTATTGTALGHQGQYTSNTAGSGYGSGSTNVDNDGYGSTSGTSSSAYKTQPVEAVDPHSTKGQNAMYHASSGGPNTGYGTSTNDYGVPGRASTDDVDRSRHGGITNSMGSSGTSATGGGYNLSNPSAIPTAGGQKVGGVGEGEGHRDHHLGRDAAGVAGAGALGTGAYEAERKHHHGHGQDSSRLTGDNYNTSGQSNTTGARDNYGGSGLSNTTGTGRDHHYGRDAAIGAGALGTAGAYEEHKHRDRDETGRHLGSKHHNDHPSTGRDQLPQASSYPEMYNSGDSRGDQYSSGTTGLGSGHKDHHYGRDAAVAGTGALGAGEYEKRHHDRDNVRDDKYDNTTSSSGGGVTSSIKNKLGMGSSNTNTTSGTSSRGNEPSSSHHYHDDEEREIEERLEEIRLNRRLKEIRAGRQV